MDEMCKRYSFDPKYFLGFENFLGRALFSNPEFFDDNYSLYVRKIGVSPFFARRFVLPFCSGSAETHFPSEERKNDATSIDQNRMTPRKGKKFTRWKQNTLEENVSFFPSFHPLCAIHSPHSGLPSVVRVKWFFVGLAPVPIFSRWLRSERNS